MNASLAPSAAPHNHIKVWCDSRRIYAELPTLGPVCVMAFDRSGNGLSKVLSLIYGHGEAAGEVNPSLKPKLVGTPAQHSLAEAILRRNRVIR